MALPLAGINIFNATRLLPGGYCATLLSALGAEIIKLEHPVGGDPGRLRPDIFSLITRGNKSITIDMSKDKGKEICYKITKKAHVFMESFRPGVATKLGIDYNALKAINPKIIYASISGFGQEGPYRHKPAHDSSYQGLAGMLASQISEAGGEFHAPSVPVADYSSGMFAAISILGAILTLKESGKGQYLDVAMEDGLISWMSNRLVPNRPLVQPHHPATGIYKTKDGKFLTISIAYEQHFWRNLCGAINRKDLSELTEPDWTARSEELGKLLKKTFGSKSQQEWIQILTEADVPHGPLYTTPEEVLGDAQVKYRKLAEETEDEDGRKVTRIGPPLKSYGMQVANLGRPPRLGEHSEEILLSVGYSKQDIQEMKKAGVI